MSLYGGDGGGCGAGVLEATAGPPSWPAGAGRAPGAPVRPPRQEPGPPAQEVRSEAVLGSPVPGLRAPPLPAGEVGGPSAAASWPALASLPAALGGALRPLSASAVKRGPGSPFKGRRPAPGLRESWFGRHDVSAGVLAREMPFGSVEGFCLSDSGGEVTWRE